MKYLIALFLLVSPGFACEHRSSFLHKTPDFSLLDHSELLPGKVEAPA